MMVDQIVLVHRAVDIALRHMVTLLQALHRRELPFSLTVERGGADPLRDVDRVRQLADVLQGSLDTCVQEKKMSENVI